MGKELLGNKTILSQAHEQQFDPRLHFFIQKPFPSGLAFGIAEILYPRVEFSTQKYISWRLDFGT